MFTGENVLFTQKQPIILFVLFVNLFFFCFVFLYLLENCAVQSTVCEGKALLSLREVRCIQDHTLSGTKCCGQID